MTRISDVAYQQILLSGFQQAQSASQDSQIQLSSGKKYQDYGGYGADVSRLLNAEALVTRAGAYEGAANVAESRLSIQQSGLETMSDAVAGIRQNFIETLSTGASELMLPDISTEAQRILSALNIEFGGVFVFGGADGARPPVDASTLDDLTAAGSISGLFQEGPRITLAIEQGVNIDGGPIASEIATRLLSELQELGQAESVLGPFDGELTAAQRDFIVEKNFRLGEIVDDLVQLQGLNGVGQAQAASAATRNRDTRDLAEIAAAEIEDADIAAVIARLNQDQIAVQAAARALAGATEISLLNFI